MLIKPTSQAITAVVLSHWMAGRRGATVYIDPNPSGTFCEVTQYDPE